MASLRNYNVRWGDDRLGEALTHVKATGFSVNFDSRVSKFYMGEEMIGVFFDTRCILCIDELHPTPTDETRYELDSIIVKTNGTQTP